MISHEELIALHEWMREPDWAENFSLEDMANWINRRPTHTTARLIDPAQTLLDPDDKSLSNIADWLEQKGAGGSAKIVREAALALRTNAQAAPNPARYWQDMYTDLLKRVDAGEPAQAALRREAREKEITRLATIEECARIADGFTCGICGMDGKSSAAIRALALSSTHRDADELSEWKQAASVEAGLRREFMAQVDAAREFVKRHPALTLIDLAEFEAFLKVPAVVDAALSSTNLGSPATGTPSREPTGEYTITPANRNTEAR